MNHLLRTIIIFVIFQICVTTAGASVIRANSYSEGLAKAKSLNAPLVVLVHGSDWNSWGETVNDRIFKSKPFEQSLTDGTVILADVDILQSPDEEQKKKNDARNKDWKGAGVYTYPAICAYASDGTLLGTCQGKKLPKDITQADKAIKDLITSCLKYNDLSDKAATAKAKEDTKAELKALAELGELNLTQPKGFLERIKELDPTDSSGHYAKLSFPHWNKLFLDATNRTKKGEGAAVEAELNEMLKCKVYSNEQIALIHAALGTCHRQQEGHEIQAAAAFKKAWETAPKSFAGQIGKRSYEAWYTK